MSPYVVDQVHNVANKSVNAVQVRNVDTGAVQSIEVEGVFVAIGHDPNTKVFRGQLEMDDAGYLITHDGPKTSVGGRFRSRGTSRTIITVRPSLRQARVAWPQLMRRGSGRELASFGRSDENIGRPRRIFSKVPDKAEALNRLLAAGSSLFGRWPSRPAEER